MPVLDINTQLRSALRAAAHPLKPVVLIGDKGLSDAVLQEIDRNLSAHGLIKVRAGGEDRAARDELLYQICDAVGCAPVHHLGKIFILFRPTERDPDATAVLGGRKIKSDVATLGTGARKSGEAHLPKKLAVVGKPASEARAPRGERPARPERETGLTARERYLGTDKRQRPSTHEETGSRRGAARTTPPRRPSGLSSTLGAAKKTSARRTGSSLSLRAGARKK
ncbi:YhbY family RNA-binding protein [Pigmentiphaga humi]|nr:YhbY family RNA-binding protein [Pigmentiphaga humi]